MKYSFRLEASPRMITYVRVNHKNPYSSVLPPSMVRKSLLKNSSVLNSRFRKTVDVMSKLLRFSLNRATYTLGRSNSK